MISDREILFLIEKGQSPGYIARHNNISKEQVQSVIRVHANDMKLARDRFTEIFGTTAPPKDLVDRFREAMQGEFNTYQRMLVQNWLDKPSRVAGRTNRENLEFMFRQAIVVWLNKKPLRFHESEAGIVEEWTKNVIRLAIDGERPKFVLIGEGNEWQRNKIAHVDTVRADQLDAQVRKHKHEQRQLLRQHNVERRNLRAELSAARASHAAQLSETHEAHAAEVVRLKTVPKNAVRRAAEATYAATIGKLVKGKSDAKTL